MIKGCERTEVKESDNLLAGDKEPHGTVLGSLKDVEHW